MEGTYFENMFEIRIETLRKRPFGGEKSRYQLGTFAVEGRREHLSARTGRHLRERTDPRQQKLLLLLDRLGRLVAVAGRDIVKVRSRRVQFR